MTVWDVFRQKRPFIIGMVHCQPLLGTPGFDGNSQNVLYRAVQDAVTLEKAGVDGIMVENMCDDPLGTLLTLEETVGLTAVATMVKHVVGDIPVGIDAAFCDCKASLAIAKTLGCQFVRIPVFVDTVLYSGGIIYPCAYDCMYYRKQIGAEDVMILADVQVKHTHMLMKDISIEQSAKDAVACGADGLIVTGTATGGETPLEMIRRVKEVVDIPVLAGSGVNSRNIKEQMSVADGAIVGTALKKDGILKNPISFELTSELMNSLRK